MKRRLTLSFALVTLASISWAAINLNSSRSNIYRFFYNGDLMSQAQAAAVLSDTDKIGSAKEARLKQLLPAILEKHGVKAADVAKTIIRLADKKHKQTTIILLMEGDDEAAAIAVSDEGVPSDKSSKKE